MTLEKLNEKLFDAVKRKNIDKVKEALSLGADINSTDDNSWTVLIHTAYWGYTEIVKLLIEHGADVNSADGDGWIPFIYAAYYGHIDIVGLFLEHNVDVNTVDNYGNTALMWACEYGHTDIVRLLIEHEADINIKNNEEQTALDILQRQYPNRYQKLIESTVIKIRREQLDTEDSLADPSPVDWDI